MSAPVVGAEPRRDGEFSGADVLVTFVVRSLSDRICEVVRDRIVSGEIRAGDPIRQDSLAAEFGVSKIPLREALARLEREGLVLALQNRGFIASALSKAEALEVFALRAKLEPALARDGAALADDVARDTMSQAMAEMQSPRRSGPAYLRDRAFHVGMIEPANRPLSMSLMQRLLVLTDRYVVAYGMIAAASDVGRHTELYQAWMERRLDAVERLTAEHLEQALGAVRTAAT